MTRDDIYDHLAKVYLGKKEKADPKIKKQFNVWLVINIVITGIIFASTFYGLTAFLSHQRSSFKKNIIFSLYNGIAKVPYDFSKSFSSAEAFSLDVSDMDVSKFNFLKFSVRAEDGTPGTIKIQITNRKNEISSYYLQGVQTGWKEIEIPLLKFVQISDWTKVKDISFILESWNVDDKKGLMLIDEIRFSS